MPPYAQLVENTHKLVDACNKDIARLKTMPTFEQIKVLEQNERLLNRAATRMSMMMAEDPHEVRDSKAANLTALERLLVTIGGIIKEKKAHLLSLN